VKPRLLTLLFLWASIFSVCAEDLAPSDFASYTDYLAAVDAKNAKCKRIKRSDYGSVEAWRNSLASAGCSLRDDERENWHSEVYYIDTLKVTTRTKTGGSDCHTGGIHKISLKGQISPDSSFAMERILQRLPSCRSTDGHLIKPIVVSMNSGGGLLSDGYVLGRLFRENEITANIQAGEICASSCAVAFLGGTKRIVEDNGVIMYHAPYFTGENVYGKRDINCEVGEEALNELNAYYREMTDAETGDRLFERTMWYCSAEDGWVVKGGSAAELFGIATEK